MPKFLDVHPLKGFDEEDFKKSANSAVDEFAVKLHNMFYNKEEDQILLPT